MAVSHQEKETAKETAKMSAPPVPPTIGHKHSVSSSCCCSIGVWGLPASLQLSTFFNFQLKNSLSRLIPCHRSLLSKFGKIRKCRECALSPTSGGRSRSRAMRPTAEGGVRCACMAFARDLLLKLGAHPSPPSLSPDTDLVRALSRGSMPASGGLKAYFPAWKLEDGKLRININKAYQGW